MNEACEAHAGDVARGAEDAFEVPDGFGSVRLSCFVSVFFGGEERNPVLYKARRERRFSRFWVVLIQESTSIVLVEDTSESPRVIFKGLYILNLDQENVSRFGGLDLERTGQVVNLGQVDIHHVVGIIGVLDLSSCPVQAFNFNGLAVLDGSAEGH